MVECQKLFSVIDKMNDCYCRVWEDVCNMESPTAYKQGVDEVGNYFIKMANERGWFVDVLECEQAGNAICITINPEAEKAPVVFSGHIDTVHPIGLFGTPPVRRDETYIYGPGVIDCKGGVVASFFAMDALTQFGFKGRPVKLIIQSDEETSSKQSDKQTVAFMVEHAKGAAAFLNTEACDGKQVTLARKGILSYRYTITGKAAHAGSCYNGKSAIAEAAHKILQLEQYKDPAGITVNCGMIGGGTAPNTVAETCTFSADMRFADEEQHREAIAIAERVAADTVIDGCACELVKASERPAMPLVDRNIELFDCMNKIYEQCGLPQLARASSSGGSDAAYTTNAGIPTICSIGVGGGGLHSIDEYARLDTLAACAKRLAVVACYL